MWTVSLRAIYEVCTHHQAVHGKISLLKHVHGLPYLVAKGYLGYDSRNCFKGVSRLQRSISPSAGHALGAACIKADIEKGVLRLVVAFLLTRGLIFRHTLSII